MINQRSETGGAHHAGEKCFYLSILSAWPLKVSDLLPSTLNSRE